MTSHLKKVPPLNFLRFWTAKVFTKLELLRVRGVG